MEYRKEKSQHSKDLIRKHFQSDILNVSTGYYKTEKLLPVTPKPTESRNKVKEFVPHFNMEKPNMRLFNDLLSHQQKSSLSFRDFKPPVKRQNSEVNVLRKYTKAIQDTCYDEQGNFSAKKRFRLEFYGKQNVNLNLHKTFNKSHNKSLNKTIKDKRKESINKTHFSTLYLHKAPLHIPKVKSCKSIYSDRSNYTNTNYNNNNLQNLEHSPIKKKTQTTTTKKNKHMSCEKIQKNKIDFGKIDIDKIDKKGKLNSQRKIDKNKPNEKLLYFSKPQNFNKEFYSKTNQPIKSSREIMKQKDTDEKDYFDIEIKNENNRLKGPQVDQKKLKQIFLKNGLHLYDINEDKMNNLFTDKKIEAKLRKNKKDENFEKNYRNIVKELNKINIKVNRCGMINDTGFINNNIQRKRKGTPGKNLKNKENKEGNTKLNTGRKINNKGENKKPDSAFGYKRDKNIQPQTNNDYKNGYTYKMNYYNHNKYCI